ncbi:telomere length and silencing protein 1 homolog isoform X1 [Pollicipes pollicipes]|uniref:telomere length and silencing protein 1 homolog isoform X1 n=2 Tax=Pollicipes pollicipes TaxID=41117 RepID=UPI001884D62F|nr:telomere length and silencing protein 1 homolog isoform X1 [Pollicipes pollicipes]XP_037083382.1 telomere length and silencing protein 1 homolog isoform X1 [Pollicipes pollicipes]XP_037083383.1 telomere length and silencing protein 1 homolog isoform X1 [Pollicipes pollicipes]XP_037083384.1 telomere length and silencing protein 1 homolog isoform X1 [Pollicipes pollicipes]XP_037083386.1 telomere length and silencing protein 1 homolog isoform X1 [Pollicipes pollicipes]
MFKKIKKKPLRERPASSDSEGAVSEDEEAVSIEAKLEEAKEIQKLRRRAHGIDVETLAKGEIKKETKKQNDPFKKNTGGMLDLAEIKKGGDDTDDAYDTGIGTTFSAETNKRDEDAEMQKYIEAELAKRRGVQENEDDQQNMYMTPEQVALMAVPEHLRKSSNKKSEEMLSNQMLSGIPEVDLGIDAKLKNIEATEAAKMKLIADQLNKSDGPSHFVPTNMAVNFVQHNRFSIKEPAKPKKPEPKPEPKPVLVVGGVREEDTTEGKRKQGQASDDYLFNKFKKQFKR